MHGMLGAGYAELTGGSAVTGFAAGAATELASPYLSGAGEVRDESSRGESQIRRRDPVNTILASARGKSAAALVGGIAAFAAGGSAEDISTAGMVSSSAMQYNRELHPDAYVLKERAKELARRNGASESELEDIEDASYYLAGAAKDLDPSDKSAKAEEIRARAALGEKKARAVEKLLDSTAESGYDRRIWTDHGSLLEDFASKNERAVRSVAASFALFREQDVVRRSGFAGIAPELFDSGYGEAAVGYRADLGSKVTGRGYEPGRAADIAASFGSPSGMRYGERLAAEFGISALDSMALMSRSAGASRMVAGRMMPGRISDSAAAGPVAAGGAGKSGAALESAAGGEENKGIYSPRETRKVLEERYPGKVSSTTVPDPTAKNVKLAGTRHPTTGVVFDDRGFAIFDDVAKFDTRISLDVARVKMNKAHMRSATKDLRDSILSGKTNPKEFTFEQMKDIMAGKETIDGLTWHHHQEKGRMQLIPHDLHKKTGHVGGMELWFQK